MKATIKNPTRLNLAVDPHRSGYLARNGIRASQANEGLILEATDTFIYVATKAEGQVDAPVILPVDAWKDHTKKGGHIIECTDDDWSTNRGCHGKMPSEPAKDFPDVSNILPDIDGRTQITIDADKLAQIQEALGGEAITIWVGGANEPIAVSGVQEIYANKMNTGIALLYLPSGPSYTHGFEDELPNTNADKEHYLAMCKILRAINKKPKKTSS